MRDGGAVSRDWETVLCEPECTAGASIKNVREREVTMFETRSIYDQLAVFGIFLNSHDRALDHKSWVHLHNVYIMYKSQFKYIWKEQAMTGII